jgi:ParB-like chromosome segregation protein Spo0J
MEQRKIEHTIVDIDSIETHPKNVRQGDIGAISESLKAHGQYRPIVVDKRTNRILAGNHTWKAAKSLGWTQINAGYIETKDDDEALRILLADNKANDLATYNESELIELLKQLADTDEGLLGTLFDGQELDDLISDDQQNQLGEQLTFAEKYEVVIECKDENEQASLLERLYNEGLTVRALTI